MKKQKRRGTLSLNDMFGIRDIVGKVEKSKIPGHVIFIPVEICPAGDYMQITQSPKDAYCIDRIPAWVWGAWFVAERDLRLER